jgi:4-carboxymuconolactone decarboxylase
MSENGGHGSREERGADAYASQLGMTRDEALLWFKEQFGERFAEEAVNAAGGAWVDDCLTPRDRSLVVVAALVTQGGVDDRLRTHIRWAVERGSSREELEALVTLLAVYVGYPRASIAMELVRAELSEIEATPSDQSADS